MKKRPEAEEAVCFYAELQERMSVGACSELFRGAVARFGIEVFACGEIDLDDRDRNVMFIAEWPKAWMRLYIKSGFIQRDPVLNPVTLYRKPFTFGDIVRDTRFSSLEREAVRAAGENGWSQGLAVPVARGGSRFGLVTLVGRGGEIDPSLRLHPCLISECLSTRVRSLAQGPEADYAMPPAGLSKPEVEAARLVALARRVHQRRRSQPQHRSFGSAGTFTNNNLVFGNGTVTVPISKTGTVEANGGTLTVKGPITGTTGTIKSDAEATVDLSLAAGPSTAGTLANNGNLTLGSHNITVTSDYTNASFGSGNAFANHNAVSGAGQIFAANATVDLSGPDLSGSTLDVGKVRTNGSTGSSSTTLTITNNGTMTNLIGAVQNTGAPSILLNGGLTGADWTAAHGGGSSTITVAFTGVSAGMLSGTLDVVNNFDNVASQTLNVTGTVYQIAQAGPQPTSLPLMATRLGLAPQTAGLTIQNAPRILAASTRP